jgi:hypothetical protein
MNNQEILKLKIAPGFVSVKIFKGDTGYNPTTKHYRSLADIKRIVELEAYLQKVQADRINDIAIERKRWAKEDLVALEILRLEQQAKGIENFLSKANIMWADSIWGPVVGADDLRFCMDALLDKAKALKEKEL